jgi:hypothetical protein
MCLKIDLYWKRTQQNRYRCEEVFVAVPPDRDEHPVRVFSTFTEDLEKLAQWLVSCGITTVAMEHGSLLDSALRRSGEME